MKRARGKAVGWFLGREISRRHGHRQKEVDPSRVPNTKPRAHTERQRRVRGTQGEYCGSKPGSQYLLLHQRDSRRAGDRTLARPPEYVPRCHRLELAHDQNMDRAPQSGVRRTRSIVGRKWYSILTAAEADTVAEADGQLPRALTTLPTAGSDAFGHSRGIDRTRRTAPGHDGRRDGRWYQTPRPGLHPKQWPEPVAPTSGPD